MPAAGLGTFSGGGLGFGVVFTLKNAFSKTAKEIQADMDKLDGRTAKIQQSISKSLSGIAKGATLIGIGTALLAPLTIGIKRIATLDDLMADVRKTTGLTQDGVKDLKEELQTFDTRTSLEDLLDISRIGGQLGTAEDQIAGFTESIDRAVVALGDEFGGGAEQVASELGKINSIFRDTENLDIGERLTKIGSAINALGAAGLATAPFLSDFTKRLGPDAVDAGVSLQNILGMGAALEELGATPERASSSVSRLFNVISTKTKEGAKAIGITQEAFENMINQDANKAILFFAKRLREANPTNTGFKQALKDVGITGVGLNQVMSQLGSNTELVAEKQRLANVEYGKGTSLLEEFNLKNNTIQARMDKLRKTFLDISEAIAVGVMPMFEALIWVVSGLAKGFLWLAKTQVGKFLLTLVGILGALLIVLGLVTIAINGTRIGLMAMASALFRARARAIQYIIANKGVVAGMKVMAKQAWRTAVAMLAAYWPVVLVVGLIAAAVFAVVATYKAATKAFADFLKTGEKGKGLVLVFQKIGAVIQAVREMFSNEKDGKTFLSKKTFESLQKLGLVNFVIKLSTWISRLKAFWEGLMQGFNDFITVVGPIFTQIFDEISMIFEDLGFDISRLGGSLAMFRAFGRAAFAPMILAFRVVAFVVRHIARNIRIAIGLIKAMIAISRKLKEVLIDTPLSKIKGFFGFGGDPEDEENPTGSVTLPEGTGPTPEQAAEVLANSATAPATAALGATPPSVNNNLTQGDVTVKVEIDSDPIVKKVMEKQEFNNAIEYGG